MLFLLLASPWFLLIDFAFLALIVLLTEREMGTAAGAVLILALGAYFFFSGINPLVWLIPNFGTFVVGTVGYLVIGVFWSLLKFFFYARKDESQKTIRRLHQEYQTEKKKHDAAEAQAVKADTKYRENVSDANEPYIAAEFSSFKIWMKKNSYNNPLAPTQNKLRITRWMVWWPTSIIWTVCSDLIINIYNFIYDKIAFIFTAILDKQIDRAISNND